MFCSLHCTWSCSEETFHAIPSILWGKIQVLPSMHPQNGQATVIRLSFPLRFVWCFYRILDTLWMYNLQCLPVLLTVLPQTVCVCIPLSGLQNNTWVCQHVFLHFCRKPINPSASLQKPPEIIC